jgi:hypothetical protein
MELEHFICEIFICEIDFASERNKVVSIQFILHKFYLSTLDYFILEIQLFLQIINKLLY